MAAGIDVSLDELIALKRFTTKDNTLRMIANDGPKNKIRRGHGMEFAEVRHYQPGDDMRHMDWRVTAKTQTPHVKLYHEEKDRPGYIVADFNPTMRFGTRVSLKSVVGAKLAALVAWTQTAKNFRVGGVIFSEKKHHEFLPTRDKQSILPFLKKISDYSQLAHDDCDYYSQENESFLQMLKRLRHVVKPQSTIVIISDFYLLNDISKKYLAYLKQHNHIICYQVTDVLEKRLALSMPIRFSDGRHDVVMHAEKSAVRQAYAKQFTEYQQQLTDFFQQINIPHYEVTAEMDLSHRVKTTLYQGY